MLYEVITFWPFLSAPNGQMFTAGSSFSQSMRNYGVFYLATSFVWDTTRAIGNLLLMLFFGKATLKVLRRFQKRFYYVQLEQETGSE